MSKVSLGRDLCDEQQPPTLDHKSFLAFSPPHMVTIGIKRRIPCPDDVDFNDELHTRNVFRDENGKDCKNFTFLT